MIYIFLLQFVFVAGLFCSLPKQIKSENDFNPYEFFLVLVVIVFFAPNLFSLEYREYFIKNHIYSYSSAYHNIFIITLNTLVIYLGSKHAYFKRFSFVLFAAILFLVSLVSFLNLLKPFDLLPIFIWVFLYGFFILFLKKFRTRLILSSIFIILFISLFFTK